MQKMFRILRVVINQKVKSPCIKKDKKREENGTTTGIPLQQRIDASFYARISVAMVYISGLICVVIGVIAKVYNIVYTFLGKRCLEALLDSNVQSQSLTTLHMRFWPLCTKAFQMGIYNIVIQPYLLIRANFCQVVTMSAIFCWK